MRCARLGRLIEPYVDGRLTSALEREVTAHLEGCARCRERVALARSVAGVLGTPGRTRAPRKLASGVMEQVYREAFHRRSRETARRTVRGLLGMLPPGVYRRLGMSVLASAAVLAASLFVPRSLILGRPAGDAQWGLVGEAMVKATLSGATEAVKGALRSAGDSASDLLEGRLR